MKKCTWCGKEYPDDALVCVLDQRPLQAEAAAPTLHSDGIPPLTSRTDAPAPSLWNPSAAACWSLIFSPAFGAFLHARNAEALGREDEARANRAWFYVSIAYVVFAFVTTFMPAIPEGLFRLAAFGLLLGWYFSLGKKQIVYVRETWRDGYERKPWKKPLLIAFGCLIGAFIMLFVLALAEEFIFSSQ